MENINWKEVRENYELDMESKLGRLPGHREASEKMLPLRSLISHELPETSSKDLYLKLINLVISGKETDLQEIKNEYLHPELEKERIKLDRYKREFGRIRMQALGWIKQNLSENQLQTEWKGHESWLPRRYLLYEDPNAPFQQIAADTLARYYLITSDVKIQP